MSDSTPPAVLVICTGNTCRSPMAAYELEHRAAARGLPLAAFSRGTQARAGASINPHALAVLEEAGVSLDAARKHRAAQSC